MTDITGTDVHPKQNRVARIAAIADAYDAMTSDRPYRRGMPPEQAMAILHEGAGRQWDAGLVAEFARLAGDILGAHPECTALAAQLTLIHVSKEDA